jgi:hypothetical protein
MSQDVVVLLDYVGWTSERELHVVGVSLGGMIAQGERSQSMDFQISPELYRIGPQDPSANRLLDASCHESRRDWIYESHSSKQGA